LPSLKNDFVFWDDEIRVKPRKFRYYLNQGRLLQGESLKRSSEKEAIIRKRRRFKNFLRTDKGVIYRVSLTEKLLTLVLNKSATLDPEGVGVEMEADKPGWCDSLNGLPALFGSSLCETLELKRTCLVLINILKKLQLDGVKSIDLAEEVVVFYNRLSRLLNKYNSLSKDKRDYIWWDKSNEIKESFRKSTFHAVKGKEEALGLDKLKSFLEKLVVKINLGLAKAYDKKSGLPFSYFTYEVKDYKSTKTSIMPNKFSSHALPLFLAISFSKILFFCQNFNIFSSNCLNSCIVLIIN